MKKLVIYIFLLVLISTSTFAKTIKWTKCKTIENPISDSVIKVIQDKEFFKKMNEDEKVKFIEKILQGKTILHEIIFDFEKNLVSVNKQEKDEEIKKTENKFKAIQLPILDPIKINFLFFLNFELINSFASFVHLDILPSVNSPVDLPCPEYSNFRKFKLFLLQNFCMAIGFEPIISDINPWKKTTVISLFLLLRKYLIFLLLRVIKYLDLL